jgi:hypothetical protein
MAVRLSALRTFRTLLPRNIIILIWLVFISVRGWVNPRGNLKFETIRYNHESCGNRTREWLRWRGPTDPSSRQGGRPTSTNPQLSESNINLFMGPKWVPDTKTDWPLNIGRNVTLTWVVQWLRLVLPRDPTMWMPPSSKLKTERDQVSETSNRTMAKYRLPVILSCINRC